MIFQNKHKKSIFYFKGIILGVLFIVCLVQTLGLKNLFRVKK